MKKRALAAMMLIGTAVLCTGCAGAATTGTEKDAANTTMVGAKIRAWRLRLKMTQENFALATSLYQSQLSNYENCLIIPTRMVLRRIADAIGIDPESLEGDDMEGRTR